MTDHKVLAITGAGSGIGAATAQLLVKRAMTVVLGSRGEDGLKTVADRIAADVGRAYFWSEP